MCSKHKEEDAAELRANINGLLRKGKAPKPNLNKQERIALTQLKKGQDRVILMADIGVVMVVLDKEEYINKAKDLLSQSAYKVISKDPTNKIKAQLKPSLEKSKRTAI